MKQSVAKVQLQVSDVDQRVKNVQTQMHAYDESIHHFNDLCDGIVEENSSNSTLVQELNKRVSKLEADSDEMKDKHEKMEEKMTDLQWRSMRENLIFTGIKERDYPNEDTETSLRLFLADEMNIHYDIPFDRVHRLGKFDSTKIYPRPIIAKFERFRDRERVRLAAPAALQGKDYGVSEQFPAEIENKRRELYPIMKRYKQNTNNKVALVRDKLYINGVQYIPSSSENRSNSQTDHKRSYQPYQREHEHIHSRTFTRRFSSHTGYKSGSMASTESSSKCWDNGAPSIETPNRFRHLRNVTDENEMLSEVSYGKRKATSPLQDETSLKKQSSDLLSEPQYGKYHSEMTITISASPREEPMEANLIDSPTKSENSALVNTENTPTSPTISENRGTFTTGHSASRDSSPDSRNSVNGVNQ